jgi:hypothetical protein
MGWRSNMRSWNEPDQPPHQHVQPDRHDSRHSEKIKLSFAGFFGHVIEPSQKRGRRR